MIGRESELALLGEFLGWDLPVLALLVTGGPGIGKTALWEEGLRLCGARGIRVLLARPSGAEAELSFAGLYDLLAGIDVGNLTGLPGPQRRGLEAALLRAEPAGDPTDRFAVAAGFLSVLRLLASGQPLLVAVDDVQWLDAASTEALAFAARRAAGQRFRFLLTRRSGAASELENELGPERLRTVELGPLGLAATRRLLTQRALALTPPGAGKYPDRVLAVAQRLHEVGELSRVAELLGPWIARLPAGGWRARAHLLLGEATSLSEHERHLQLALADAGQDAVLRAAALAARSRLLAVVRVERIEEAEALATQALQLARSEDARADEAASDQIDAGSVQRHALQALAWARVLRGLPVEQLSERLPELSGACGLYEGSMDRPAGVRLAFRGEVEQARALLHRQLVVAEEGGEALFGAVLILNLCELELRAGAVGEAARLLARWAESGVLEGVEPAYARCQAMVAALAGRQAEVEQWAAAAAEPSATGDPWDKWDELELQRARGLAALLAGDPELAASALMPLWEHAQREGVTDPGAFPVAPDLVEAFVWMGQLGQARAVSGRLRELAESQDHPWGLITAARCEAVIGLADGYAERAADQLVSAAARFGALGLEFDRARSLLWLGRQARRARKRASARRLLHEASSIFGRLGTIGWNEQAQAELDLLGSGPPAPGVLTRAEQRVAELAAAGLSNKEIARRLFVAVHTVEVHLTHAYAKLGIRSRAQLARRLRD